MTCNLLQCLVALDKLHKISIEKEIRGTPLKRQLHYDVTNTNFSSIQHGIIICDYFL
jgi:hypothetical protein